MTTDVQSRRQQVARKLAKLNAPSRAVEAAEAELAQLDEQLAVDRAAQAEADAAQRAHEARIRDARAVLERAKGVFSHPRRYARLEVWETVNEFVTLAREVDQARALLRAEGEEVAATITIEL